MQLSTWQCTLILSLVTVIRAFVDNYSKLGGLPIKVDKLFSVCPFVSPLLPLSAGQGHRLHSSM